MRHDTDPMQRLAELRHELGEHGGVNMCIEASSTFTALTTGSMDAMFAGKRGPDTGGCYLYGRHENPTVHELERQLAAIESTEAAACTASGLSAIAGALLQLTAAGDHIVSARTIYGGTFALLSHFLPAHTGITTTFVDPRDLAAVEASFTDRTRVLYVEGISNPTLSVANLPALADIAHRYGAKLVVDNTFSPLVITPANHGADVVVHSLTKFIGGASDLIGGAICGDRAFIEPLHDLSTGTLMLLGPTMDPHVAFTVSLRLPHLGLRMIEHARRAQLFASRLAEMGVPVCYPGLPDHPDHALLETVGNRAYGAGGVFTIDAGTHERAGALMESLQLDERFGFIAVSLGYFDTLMSCSASSTASELTEDELAGAGISPGLVRIAVGYTGDIETRWEQLSRAITRVGPLSRVA